MPRKVHSYNGEKCPVVNCDKLKSDIGYCGMHAQRFRRYGDVNYITPESLRRVKSREAQPNLGKLKSTTYKKLLGRHEHRIIMEKKLGRKLKRNEIVHHIDGNKHNNSLENLELMTQSEHIKLHHNEMTRARKTKTHCPKGHSYTGENLFINKRNIKVCRICARDAARKNRQKCNQEIINSKH